MFLYGRKVVSILIGFFTSRLLLERLGETDFGLYGLIGSVIVLFSSLRAIFSTSIQRYVNVAKASGRPEDVQKIFSIGTVIQLLLGITFMGVVEIGGAFLIPNLNIPAASVGDAWWVFHLSLFSAVVFILTAPYDALIVSNEKFNFYAAMTILDSVLRLSVVALLIIYPTHRVVWYALLILAVSVTIRLINMVYCRRTFGIEAKFKFVKDTNLFKEMAAFAGWSFLGGTGHSIANNGINFILNIFGGVTLNTARAIAAQVQANVIQFITDMSVGFQPRSIMTYTKKEYSEFYSLLFWNSKVNFFMASVMSVTLLCVTYPILKFWLADVPEWSTIFTKCLLIHVMVLSLHDPIDTLFRAAGKMKWYQITELAILTLNIPFSWIALKLGAPFYSVFIVFIIVEMLNFTAMVIIAKITTGFLLKKYIKEILFPIIATCFILAALYLCCTSYIPAEMNFWSLLGTVILIAVIVISIASFTLFNHSERTKLATLFHLDKIFKHKSK